MNTFSSGGMYEAQDQCEDQESGQEMKQSIQNNVGFASEQDGTGDKRRNIVREHELYNTNESAASQSQKGRLFHGFS